MTTSSMVVRYISKESNRVLFYERSEGNGYHVIAEPSQFDRVNLGDTIEFEYGGANFGWFLKKLSPLP